MAIWDNGKLIVYHGTDSQAFATTSSIDLGLCTPGTDFGQGFYTTTHLHQARQWANKKVGSKIGPGQSAAVYRYEIDRDELAGLDALAFVRASRDFWSFLTACRRGGVGPYRGTNDHGRDPNAAKNGQRIYDIVFGLVTLWPQRLVIFGCDQISFHTQDAIGVLKSPVSREIPKNGATYF